MLHGNPGRVAKPRRHHVHREALCKLRLSGSPEIVEKPVHPKSNYAVVGIYMYDPRVFSIIKTLKPSDRGELEITDVNNVYIRSGEMKFDLLDGWWADAGESIEYLLKANNLVARDGANKMEL